MATQRVPPKPPVGPFESVLKHPIWHFHLPITMFRGLTVSSSEGPSATVRMRPAHPMWHFRIPSAAFRGPTGSSPEGPSGTVRKRPETTIVTFSDNPVQNFVAP
eukprot:6199791-Pyramimonas_sp.AAC.1